MVFENPRVNITLIGVYFLTLQILKFRIAQTIKSIWTCLITCLKHFRNFHLSTWKKFELFSYKIIYFWNQFLILFSISSNQGRFRTSHFHDPQSHIQVYFNFMRNREKFGNPSHTFMQYQKFWCTWWYAKSTGKRHPTTLNSNELCLVEIW